MRSLRPGSLPSSIESELSQTQKLVRERNQARGERDDLRRMCLATADALDVFRAGMVLTPKAIYEVQRLSDSLRKAAGKPEDPNVAAARRGAM